jgi:predicted Zn-dependent protease with MMP-like domain
VPRILHRPLHLYSMTGAADTYDLAISHDDPRRTGIMEAMAVTMSDEAFEELVSEALDLIPRKFARAMDNVVVLVEPHHPTRSLYGLYHGVALTSRTSNYSWSLPDTITIYRDPILAHAADLEGARQQVTTTVIHEVAHHFGIDDDRLDELGWG